jgi:hypothetical protein
MDATTDTYRDAGQRLTAADAAARRAEVARLEAVLEMVDAYPAPEPLSVPGAEQLVAAGSDGAGRVGDFVALDVAALLGVTEAIAWTLVHETVNLRSRHPRLWEAAKTGLVEGWRARQVARACDELDAEAARWVDVKLAGVWGTAAWPKVWRTMKGLVLQADKVLALEKARKAQAERFVRITHNGDSTSFLSARMDTGAALALQDAIRRITGRLVDQGAIDPVPELQIQALEELAAPYLPGIDGNSSTACTTASGDPSATDGAASMAGGTPSTAGGASPAGSGLSGGVAGPRAANPAPRLPLADVVVHIGAEDLDPDSVGTGVARVVAAGGDVGPVLVPQIANLLRHHRIRVIPVIDMAGDPAVDAYEIPTRTKMQLQLREDSSVFPYSSRRSRSCDLDHTVAYRFARPDVPAPPGQTRPSNLGPLSRGEHRAKTHGAWTLDQPAPGLYVWTNRTGHRWAVINGHTHRLPTA